MTPLDGLALGFSVALAAQNLLAAFAGVFIGTFVGVLPAIGPVGAMALLLPVTLALPPETALILLAGILYGSMYGGAITSILINVPGEAASVVTAIEGHQLAKRGRPGPALAIAAVSSFIAGTLSVIGLMLAAPGLAEIALIFGPPEFFALALLGLITLSRLSRGSFWKALFVVALGMGLGTVGMEPVTGTARFTFDMVALNQGINLIPVIIGLVGMAELLLIAEKGGGMPRIRGIDLRTLFPTIGEWRRAVPAMFRGAGIGFPLGLIPGPAPVIATFAAYSVERRIKRGGKERFGEGAVEGIAAPEASNNAAASSALVPLLALGVPFAPVAAMLLAALTLQGVQPGPLLISERPEVFWGVVASMYVGNVALLILNLPLVGIWVSLLRFPQPLLLALIMVVMFVGTYSVNNSTFDVMVMAVMGVVGYTLKKLDFDTVPLIMALVLGPFLEESLRQSLFMSRGDIVALLERPLTAVLVVLIIVVLMAPVLWRLARRKANAEQNS